MPGVMVKLKATRPGFGSCGIDGDELHKGREEESSYASNQSKEKCLKQERR